ERSAAEIDGHPRQNPAYRPATEKALETGLFLWPRFVGNSSRFPAAREFAAVCLNRSARALGLRLPGCAGIAPKRSRTVPAVADDLNAAPLQRMLPRRVVLLP